MLINNTYKFRLYPNTNQKELISKTLECNKFIYNYFLNKRIALAKLNIMFEGIKRNSTMMNKSEITKIY